MHSFQLHMSGEQVKAVDALLARLRREEGLAVNRWDYLVPLWDAAIRIAVKAENDRLDAIAKAKAEAEAQAPAA